MGRPQNARVAWALCRSERSLGGWWISENTVKRAITDQSAFRALLAEFLEEILLAERIGAV